FVSDDDRRLSWVAGAYWTESKHSSHSQELVPIPFPGQADFEDLVIGAPLADDREYYMEGHTRYRQTAAFGEIGYKLTPNWNASLGARYFDYRADSTFFAIDQYFGEDARNADGTARTTP